MTFLEKTYEKLANVQFKFPLIFLIITLLLTTFFLIGATQVQISPQLSGEDLPIKVFDIGNKIEDEFGGRNTVIVLVELDDEIDSSQAPIDIRDKRIVEFLMNLENNLIEEDLVDEVRSIGSPFNMFGLPESNEEIKGVISQIPNSDTLFNKEYTSTLLLISTEADETRSDEITEIITEKVDLSSKPLGVKTSISGEPPLMALILDLIIEDGIFTLILSALIILIILIIVQRSLIKGFLIFIPLMLGVTWTMGTMGYLGIKINMATVGLGAILLGLGVEYSIFIFERYFEEKNKHSSLDALKISVSKVGSSITGSGSTTMAGFLALTLSINSMMADLGLALAIGIGFSLVIAIFINPAIIIFYEKTRKAIK